MIEIVKDCLKIPGFTGPVELTTLSCILDFLKRNKCLNKTFECGIFNGRTTKLISNYSGFHYCCDPKYMYEETPNVKSFLSTSAEAFSKIENEVLDFVFIDGSHNKNDVKLDLENAAKHLSDNGVILMDDTYYIDYPEVVAVLEVFLENNPDYEKLLMLPTQMYIVKTKNSLKEELKRVILYEIPNHITSDCLIYNLTVYQSKKIFDSNFESLSYMRYKYDPEYYSKRFSVRYLDSGMPEALMTPPISI